jgi:translation initiation factor IF-3
METGNSRNLQRVNEMIRVPQVRVVAVDGSQLGVMNTHEALAAARGAGLDLVEVAPEAKPPVCRIMDFGKFKYQQKRKQTKQHTHQSKLKEIRLRPKTGEHDLQVKVAKMREFLQNKDKVTVLVMFKGREMAHIEEGFKVMNQMLAEIGEIGKVESPPKQQGKRIQCTVVPK